MPYRKKNEPLEDYVSRCISVRQKEHPGEKRERSAAACFGMGRSKKWKSKSLAKPEGR
jgi:hypothetical protein